MVSDIPYTDPDKPFYRNSYFQMTLIALLLGASVWFWFFAGDPVRFFKAALVVMSSSVAVVSGLAPKAGRNRLEARILEGVWGGLWFALFMYALSPWTLWAPFLAMAVIFGGLTAFFPPRHTEVSPDYHPSLLLAWGMPVAALALGVIVSLSGASDAWAVFVMALLPGAMVISARDKSVWFVVFVLLFVVATGVAISQMIS